MDGQLKDLKTALDAQAADIYTLRAEIEILKLTSRLYLETQKHFPTAFRTKLRIDSQATTEVLEKGDKSTHIGDALFGATTFSKRMCSYDRTFCLLYGIN